jgi:hypothetical protein
MRRLAVAAIGVAVLIMLPATAAADCNGPACEPEPAVEGLAIVVTVAIVLAFAAIMAAAEAIGGKRRP